MIYLIGGPARCGKSTLATRVRRDITGQVLSGDAFVHALQENLKPDWVPDIYDHDVASFRNMPDNQAKIDRLRRRDEAMWQFFAAYIHTAVADAPGDDILLEGNLWPDYTKSLPYAHRAVFLIDTSPDQVERLKAIRESASDNNWMHDFTDEYLADWAAFNAARSGRYKKLCEQYDYPCFDISQLGMARAQDDAVSWLLQKAV